MGLIEIILSILLFPLLIYIIILRLITDAYKKKRCP